MTHPGSVLAVDDNPTARKTLEMRLRSKGYHVDTAASGQEALARLQHSAYDLILLDRKMPGLSGLDVLKRIRKRHSRSDLPVIMLTSTDRSEAVVQAIEFGANDYIVKPGTLTVLDARIRAQLSVKRLQDVSRSHHEELERRVEQRTLQLREANRRLREAFRKQEKVEQELRFSEQRYRYLYDNNPSMYFTIDNAGKILSVNHFGAQQLGYMRGELVGASILETYHADDREAARQHLDSLLRSPQNLHRWEIRKVQKSGGWLWVRESARMVSVEDYPPTILVVCEDISETQYLSEKLNYEANHDALTGLKNRRRFERMLKDLLTNVWHDKTSHALCYLDLDQFKVINETCGHTAGDMLLKQIGEVLGNNVRRQDSVARLGGDEFGVLLTHCTEDEAQDLAQTLLSAVHEHRFAWAETMLRISASMGVVMINEHNCDVENLLSVADTACFEAKDSGRNRIHLFSQEDSVYARRFGEMEWVARINHALSEDRLALSMQPIVPVCGDAGDGAHYELLLRMLDESGRLVLPGEFLPAAERYNLAAKIDRWVVARALEWLCSNPRVFDRLHLLSINLSGQSLGDEELLRFVLAQIDAGTVPGNRLCFEVTETAAIGNMLSAQHFIGSLRQRGCSFALDDFGIGLSSFGYLKELPVDFLKIDGLFVRDIDTNSIDFAMVKSINEIGHVMGIKTIAEFVENDSILELLGRIKVDFAQGYGIGKPRPIDDFEQIILQPAPLLARA